MKIVSAEHRGSSPDPRATGASSEQWGAWEAPAEDLDQTQPVRRVRPGMSDAAERRRVGDEGEPNSQFTLREHAQGAGLSPAPQPSPHPYGQPGTPGGPTGSGNIPYPPPYAGYSPYPQLQYAPYSPYAPLPPPGYGMGYRPRPKRRVDSLAVTVLVLSCVAVLVGLGCILLAALVLVQPQNTTPQTLFAAVVGLGSFSTSGIVGGVFGLYHSIRTLNGRNSAALKMPPFWIFLLLYIAVIGIAALLSSIQMAVTYPMMTALLIGLAAIFPAFIFVSLGVRRLRLVSWQTTWRRFALALISGATMSILLASIAELGLQLLLIQKMHITVTTAHCIDNPDGSGCQTPQSLFLMFMLVSVIAPVVEETVKPLGVAMLIRRLSGPREAFTLGLAAGIGFNLVETVGYMSSQYGDWLSVALLRSGSGLLHGFGAGMVALGWYFIVHKEERQHVRKAIGCWVYAVLQHAIWNGSFGLALLPGPVGSFFGNASLDLGFMKLDAIEIVYAIEVLIMLLIFLYVTRRLRNRDRALLEAPESRKPAGDNPGFATS